MGEEGRKCRLSNVEQGTAEGVIPRGWKVPSLGGVAEGRGGFSNIPAFQHSNLPLFLSCFRNIVGDGRAERDFDQLAEFNRVTILVDRFSVEGDFN